MLSIIKLVLKAEERKPIKAQRSKDSFIFKREILVNFSMILEASSMT